MHDTVLDPFPAYLLHRTACRSRSPDMVRTFRDAVVHGLQQNALCNERRRGTAFSLSQTAHLVIKDAVSAAFFGAVSGTHPTACKRPSGRPRRGAAKPQNPAPRPNQPLASWLAKLSESLVMRTMMKVKVCFCRVQIGVEEADWLKKDDQQAVMLEEPVSLLPLESLL